MKRRPFSITDDLLPFLRQHKEEFIRWQRDNAPVTEEMLEQETRRLAERTAAEFGVTVEEIYAGAERIARIMEEFGVE